MIITNKTYINKIDLTQQTKILVPCVDICSDIILGSFTFFSDPKLFFYRGF